MQDVSLYRGELRVARFRVDRRPIEIGTALGCDLVLEDAGLAPRHWLLTWERGTLVAHDVSRGKRHRTLQHHVPLRGDFSIGEAHRLRRESCRVSPGDARSEGDTAASCPSRAAAQLVLVIGQGGEARRIMLDHRPLHIGRGADNDVVLADRSASTQHCRLEPGPGGLVLRDLGSRNGTFVGGVRVSRATLSAGTAFRLGRTDLHLVMQAASASEREDGLVAESGAMLDVLEQARTMAALPWPLLICGESGTGKEGVARAVHTLGPRSDGPFVALNAGGLTPSLVESELFGHERGAFSGADALHRGVFEQADGGTLFLDEVGELPLDQQARLLRVLESGELRRVGSERTRHVDVRLVCATHRDLRGMVADAEFRRDLYYRLARVVIDVPPLRARAQDVAALARHFLRQIAADVGERELSEDALVQLLAYPWPGNARELRNVLCSAAAATPGSQLERADVLRALQRVGAPEALVTPDPNNLREVVDYYAGNLSAAARSLGMPRSTLRDRLGSTVVQPPC